MTKRRVIVVGAGAAGLMAAGRAAECGADVLLLEKMNQPARKLRLAGNGRCNLTNTSDLPDFLAHFRPDGRFLRQAFQQFFASDLVAFFRKLSVPTTVEKDGLVFPASGRSEDVCDALLRYIEENGAALQTKSPAERLLIDNERITGIESAGRTFIAEAVIIAAGGASYPATGSTGDGYRLAESAGHSIVPIRPALVPLKTAGDVAQKLQGVSLADVTIATLIDGKKKSKTTGDVLFTHFGLSGPAVLNISGPIVDALAQGHSVSVSIDLLPNLGTAALDAQLACDLNSLGRRQFHTLLKTILQRKMVPLCAALAQIPPDTIASQITVQQRRVLVGWLKDFRLDVVGHLPFADAMVTAGGIDTRQIDPRTMASRLVSGLYFAGEVIDIDGRTGGYNLQAAFSTARLAAIAAAAV